MPRHRSARLSIKAARRRQVTEDPAQTALLFESSKKSFRLEAAAAEDAAQWAADAEALIGQLGGSVAKVGSSAEAGGAVGGGNSIVQIRIGSCRVVADEDYEDKKHVVFEVRPRPTGSRARCSEATATQRRGTAKQPDENGKPAVEVQVILEKT